jgi:hypothetical protein
MTEAEWLAYDDPDKMLEFLGEGANPRKMRLFAVACCRRIWDGLDGESHKALDIAERYADGMATDDEVLQMADQFHYASPGRIDAACYALDVTFDRGWQPPGRATAIPYHHWAATSCAYEARDPLGLRTSDEEVEAEAKHQCRLVADIFGNPFGASPAFDPDWTGRNEGTVPKLAQAIYDELAFDRLPILADALEDAGCDNADILTHCRGPGPHVRGCWVVDLLLGKE